MAPSEQVKNSVSGKEEVVEIVEIVRLVKSRLASGP